MLPTVNIRPFLRSGFLLMRFVIHRIPLMAIQGIQSLPFGLQLYERASLSPPIRSRQSHDWMAQHGQDTDSEKPEYMLVDDACEFLRSNQPQTGDLTPHPQFSKEQNATPHASSVYVIPHGRVWGEYGAIVTRDNTLLSDLSFYRLLRKGGRHRVYSDWSLCQPKKVEGTAAVIASDSAGIYYHWFIDLLLRYALLLKAGFTLDSLDKIIVGDCSKPFQIETLTALGLDPNTSEKLIQTSHHPLVQAERLVVPSYPAAAAQYRPWQIQFLRDSFLPLTTTIDTVQPKRIYISRGDATYRRVINEAQVIELLGNYGFENIILADLSFAEQVALMASAEAIVAPHGSGLTNLIFCSPSTKVIEIFSPEMVALYFWKLSDLCDINYFYTVGDRCRSEKFDQSWNTRADILVSLERLEKTLKIAEL